MSLEAFALAVGSILLVAIAFFPPLVGAIIEGLTRASAALG